MNNSTLVIGIGNYLMQDDAAGVHAVNALRELYSFDAGLELMDGGTMGLDLLPRIEGFKRLMLIDAVDMQEPPGTIRVIEGQDMRAFLDLKFSVHQIGIPDMLFAMEFKGIAPPEMCLVGIQPVSLDTGTEMSGPVNSGFNALLDAAIHRLAGWGINSREINPGKTKADYRYVPGNSI